jgi:asparagine synthase (glutamine-hydrolysing)
MMKITGPHGKNVIVAVQMLENHPAEFKEHEGAFWVADGWDALEGKLGILQAGLDPSEIHNRDDQGLSVYLTGIGDLIVLNVDARGLNILRSRFSFKPIHYQLQANSILFSTERKALWALGVGQPVTIQPGQLLNVAWDGGISLAWRIPDLQPQVDKSRKKVALRGQLRQELMESFNKVAGKEVGVLFSGGVDSCLVAYLAGMVCGSVHLYTCFAQGSRDSKAAEEAASRLGYDISLMEMDKDLVWNLLPYLLYATERVKRKDVEIAVPFLLASREARADGMSLLLSGQGPDELFAGYSRYVGILRRAGEEALHEKLWKDVSLTHDKNIERDELAAAFGGCDLFFPYLSSSFIRSAMMVPARHKIHLDESPERKVLFRKLAMEMGLDPALSRNPKKATQYSSGSAKLLVEAMRDNVDELADATRKEVYRNMDIVLSAIAGAIGLPGHPAEQDTTLTIDLRAADEFNRLL